MRNTAELQPDCALTYLGNNIFILTAFHQALLQGHNLAIPDPNLPTGLSPLITPLSSTDLENDQYQSMRVQVLLAMDQEGLSQEEAGKLLNQRVHVITTVQELRISTRKFMRLNLDYLGI